MRLPSASSGLPQVLSGEIPADDRDGGVLRDLLVGDVSARDERRAERGEVPGQDVAESANRRKLALAIAAVLREHGIAVPVAIQRNSIRDRDRLDAGDPEQAPAHRLLSPHDLVRFPRHIVGDVQPEGLQVRRIDEARADARERQERPDHQARADQQHERERDLHDHQRAPNAVLFAAVAERTLRVAQPGVRARSGVPEDGNRTKEEARHHGESEHRQHHRGIDADVAQPGQAVGRQRDQAVKRGPGQGQTDRAAHRPNRQALAEQVERQPSPRRAQGAAHGNLPPAPFQPHEPQICDVRARDQQDDRNARHQHTQRVADVADHVVLQRPQVRAEPGLFEELDAEALRRRERAQDYRQHARDIGVRGLDCDARLEAGHSRVAEAAEMRLGPVQAKGHDDGRVAVVEEVETARQDPDDLPRLVVDPRHLPDDRRVAAVFLLPEGIAQEGRRWRVRGVVLLREQPARRRRDAKQRQQPVGHDERRHLFRFPAAGQAREIRAIQSDVLEHTALFAVHEVVGRRHVHIGEVHSWRRVPDAHQLLGVRVGQRLDQHAVEHAENGAGRADAGAEREHGYERESRRSYQTAHDLPERSDGFRHRDPYGRSIRGGRNVGSVVAQSRRARPGQASERKLARHAHDIAGARSRPSPRSSLALRPEQV